MTFGVAVGSAMIGNRVARQGWNGKGMYVRYVPGGETVLPGTKTVVKMEPYMLMFTAQGTYVPWLASQTDILATDWIVVG